MSSTDKWKDILTNKQIISAVKWYDEHSRYVLRISRMYVIDKFPWWAGDFNKDHPENWKPQHWAWFIRHWGRTMWYWREKVA